MDGQVGLTKSEEFLLLQRGYTFLEQLGEGSYAKVYLVLSRKPHQTEKILACKVINTKKAPKDFATKFLPRELDILLKLNHPNVIHVYCIFQKGPKFLTFMRYAEKGDLLDYILKNGEIPEKQARSWFYQISLAVEYLHTINVAHRDIKCENILITRKYNVKLADFGFSRFVVDYTGRELPSSTYCGSLAYASPEILRAKPYRPKCSDVWSMGVVLYIMLNKSLPFHDGNAKLLYKQQIYKSWRFRSRIEPLLSLEVKELVEKLLEPDYMKRLTISGVVHNLWFGKEGDLVMTEEERQALEAGNRLKDLLQPKKKTKAKGSTNKDLLELDNSNVDFESREIEEKNVMETFSSDTWENSLNKNPEFIEPHTSTCPKDTTPSEANKKLMAKRTLLNVFQEDEKSIDESSSSIAASSKYFQEENQSKPGTEKIQNCELPKTQNDELLKKLVGGNNNDVKIRGHNCINEIQVRNFMKSDRKPEE